MTVNGISYNDDAAVRGAREGTVAGTPACDSAGFDSARLVAALSPAQLLAVQIAVETRLTATAAASLSGESDDALLDLLDVREQAHRRGEVFDAALYIEISDRGVYRRAGHISTHQLYAHGARLGVAEARRRRVTAEGIGAFTAVSGERLEPALPATAEAVADGDAGGAHVAAITEVMDKLPTAVAHDERVRAEAMLADAARRLDPAAVTVVGNRILAWLDPDGTLADDGAGIRSPRDAGIGAAVDTDVGVSGDADVEAFGDADVGSPDGADSGPAASADTGPAGGPVVPDDDHDDPRPTLLIVYQRPPPLIPEIAPEDTQSRAEQLLIRLLAQAA